MVNQSITKLILRQNYNRPKRHRIRRRRRRKPVNEKIEEESSGWFGNWFSFNWDIFGLFSSDNDKISERIGENNSDNFEDYYDDDEYYYYDDYIDEAGSEVSHSETYPDLDLIHRLAFHQYVYPKTPKHFKNFEGG